MNSKAAKNRSFMDTLVALFKNVWLKRGVALLWLGVYRASYLDSVAQRRVFSRV